MLFLITKFFLRFLNELMISRYSMFYNNVVILQGFILVENV